MNTRPSVEIDLTAGAAYVTLSDKPVVTTEEVSDAVYVDLDEYGMVVGIELLDLDQEIPVEALTKSYHVHSDQLAAVRSAARPKSFILRSQSQGATAQTGERGQLEFC